MRFLFPAGPGRGAFQAPFAPPWLAMRLHLHPVLFGANGLPFLQINPAVSSTTVNLSAALQLSGSFSDAGTTSLCNRQLLHHL